VERDAPVACGSIDERVPWRDDVNVMSTGGDRRRDGFHEGADAIPGKARV